MRVVDESKEPDMNLLIEAVKQLEMSSRSARPIFEKLAERGSPTAMYYLGEIERRGMGCAPDIHAAEAWFLKAAEEGSALSSYALGHLLLTTGRAEQSLKFLQMAGAQGYAPALNRLGRIYSSGNGVETDFQLAKKYFQRAVDKGHVIAMGSLGHILKDHPIKPFDRVRGYWLIVRAVWLLVYTIATDGFRSEKLR